MYQFFKAHFSRILPRRIERLIEKYKTGIKYIISGGMAAAVDLGGLFILTEIAGVWYLFSAVIAFVLSLLTSFLLHKFWTFRENSLQRIKKQFIFFTALALLNLALNILLLYVAVDILNIWYMAAQFVIMGVLAFMNFIINKTITFRHENKGANNILLATGIYPPDIGGPATYVKILEEELPKYGYEVKVVTYSDFDKISNIKYQISNKFQNLNSKTQIFRIDRGQNKLSRYFKYFWQVLHLLNWANVVYAQGPVSEGLPVYWACKLRGRRYILKIVGDYAWEQGVQRFGVKESLDDFQHKQYGGRVEKMRRIERKVAQRAKKIIVPSEYLKKIVQQWGVPEDHIEVIYNAVRLQQAKPKDKPAEEKWIVTVGRLVPWKGMDTLIELMPEIRKEEPRAKLFILGDGPDYEILRVKRDKLRLGEDVELRGQSTYSEVSAFLAAADVFVLNSAYEGLSHTLLEAIMAGSPVVVSNVGGNPEVIRHAGRGHIVPYNDRIELKHEIIAALKEERHIPFADFLSIFDEEKMIGQTIKVLTS